jgi:hypothetical protein
MSLWVVAYCTRPLGRAFEPDQLDDALGDADFWTMAENQDLDESAGEAASDSLRFESVHEPARRVVLMHYRHHEEGDTFIRCEHHVDPAFVREDVESQLRQDPPSRVRELLPRIVETVAFDLKTNDWSGMGLPLAYHLAMRLAASTCGDGFVEVEGAWWDPKGYRRIE